MCVRACVRACVCVCVCVCVCESEDCCYKSQHTTTTTTTKGPPAITTCNSCRVLVTYLTATTPGLDNLICNPPPPPPPPPLHHHPPPHFCTEAYLSSDTGYGPCVVILESQLPASEGQAPHQTGRGTRAICRRTSSERAGCVAQNVIREEQ